MKKFFSISVSDSKQLINDQQPLILDCRALKDYQAEHLENALHVHEQLRDSLLKKADRQKPLLIYCYHGHASEHMAEMFSDFGFTQVYSMVGGYADWKQHHTV
jgi:thiosulfate sulfurtransferase